MARKATAGPKKIKDTWDGVWKRTWGGKYRLVKRGGHEPGTKGKKLQLGEIKGAYGVQREWF